MNQLDDVESTWGMLFLMFVLHGDGIFMENTPLKNLKINPWKFGESFWKPSFLGSMLNFGGVVIFMERTDATDTSRGTSRDRFPTPLTPSTLHPPGSH